MLDLKMLSAACDAVASAAEAAAREQRADLDFAGEALLIKLADRLRDISDGTAPMHTTPKCVPPVPGEDQ